MIARRQRWAGWVVTLAGWLALAPLWAAPVSDVANTKHNLSNAGPAGRTVTSGESQICVFCHTPHAAADTPGAPLWNRTLSGATYTMYAGDVSGSIDFTELATRAAGNSSKLCLSCHDGTLAIGNVNVANGQANVSIPMTGVDTAASSPTDAVGGMPDGSGLTTGFTRDLGVDLTNDHPISFAYTSTVASADGELRDPTFEAHIGVRAPGVRPAVPLEAGQQLECISCHDPHVTDEGLSVSNKFLRLNRFQTAQPQGGPFQQDRDINCLACHDKLGTAWSQSAHADDAAADEAYRAAAATQREFPTTPALRVWQAACLNCHDTHTVQGARRLLREATDSAASPKAGGSSAIEETCYQCHVTSAQSALEIADNSQVPNIRTDFTSTRRMPITTANQPATSEVHEITNADMIETQANLGKVISGGSLTNRHAECTDCHNPHRVMKNQRFTGDGAATEGSHEHVTTAQHSNIASGALRGAWGVEPNYTSAGPATWPTLPAGYTVKQGDRGASTSTARSATWVTREYQICLKCHSDYGYDDNNSYTGGSAAEGGSSGRPALGSFVGGTPDGTNDLNYYTNQATEFNVGANDGGTGVDQGEPSTGVNQSAHKSWHPVVFPTGRTLAVRGNMDNLWTAPWNRSGGADIGNLTMYCSDCHGSNTANGTSTPSGNNAWGPHGSSNNFILKGRWDRCTGGPDPRGGTGCGAQPDALCFKCHQYARYGDPDEGQGFTSGFSGPADVNLHGLHNKRIDNGIRCVYCHVAVPHGWKNKALMVDLLDVGTEAGFPSSTKIPDSVLTGTGAGSVNGVQHSAGIGYNRGPYYVNAINKVVEWRTSGQWREQDCGNGNTGGSTGLTWMENTCARF